MKIQADVTGDHCIITYGHTRSIRTVRIFLGAKAILTCRPSSKMGAVDPPGVGSGCSSSPTSSTFVGTNDNRIVASVGLAEGLYKRRMRASSCSLFFTALKMALRPSTVRNESLAACVPWLGTV